MGIKIKKLLLTWGGFLLLFIASTVIFSFYQTRKLEQKLNLRAPTIPSRVSALGEPLSEEPPARKIKPARPEDFGIEVFAPGTEPKTQGDWDRYISKKIAEVKLETAPEQWAKVHEFIKENNKDTEKKIKEIDESLKKLEETARIDPGNQIAKEEIERLMILKSIAKELPQ